MDIGSINTTTNSLTAPLAIQSSTEGESYEDVIKRLYPAPAYQTRDEINAADTELAKFRKDLSTKGAALFLSDQNKEKIDALVEKYRQELLKEQAKTPDKNMDIAKMVSDYKEQLLKELEEARKAKETQDNIALKTAFSTKIPQVKPMLSTTKGGALEELLNLQKTLVKEKEKNTGTELL